MRQVRLNLDTKFSENKGAGIGARYLNSGEILLRHGVEQAIACLFTPIGAAMEGATLSEVKARQEISRSIFESWMNLATSRAELNEENKGLSVETKFEDIKSSNSGFEVNGVTSKSNPESSTESEELRELTSSPTLTEINFDDEEF